MALDDTPNKLESAWIQRNTENQYYEQINVSGSDLIVYHSSSGEIQADKISVWAAKYGIGSGGSSDTASYMYFDGDRPITRTGHIGVNVGTDNVVNFLDEFFFPFQAATISLNSGTTYYETGSSPNISLNGSITANSETVFGSTGSIRKDGIDWYTFASASSYSTTDNGVSASAVYQTFIETGNDGSPTLINSSAKTISFIYPYLWGMSTTAGLAGTALYDGMSTKTIATQGTKSDSFVGVSTYIYFCYPNSYPALTSIKDPSNFEVIDSFEHSSSVSVTSTGLTNNWTTNYRVYRLILQANPNGTFVFS